MVQPKQAALVCKLVWPLRFLIVTAIFIFLTASGIYYFENEAQPEVFSSVFSSLWWAVVTLTTVGGVTSGIA